MKNLPAVTQDDANKECSAAELVDFEALSDDRDVVPITEALIKEMLEHLVVNPRLPWKYNHHGPSLLVLSRRHSLEKHRQKIVQAMWGGLNQIMKPTQNMVGRSPKFTSKLEVIPKVFPIIVLRTTGHVSYW